VKSKYSLRIFSLLVLLISLLPAGNADAQSTLPPVDMFQLPWQQGEAWVALDGFDNGTERPETSPHNYLNGGALDFTPNKDVKVGDDTSNFWVTAAAAGTVVALSSCQIRILHENGWITEYQHLGNIQVSLGEAVYRNQRLAIIHNNADEQVCPGNIFPYPHLHFSLRPNMNGLTLAGWLVNYDPASNKTTFSKNGQTIENWSFQPISNVPDLQIALRDPLTWDTLYTGTLDTYRYERWPLTLTETQTFTVTATGTTPGLVPVIVLLDANGNEITRGTGTLTITQPAGNYYVQIQPEAGQGFYDLMLQGMGSSNPTPTPTTSPGGPTPTSTTNPGGPTPTSTTNPGGPTPTSTTNPGGPTPTSTTNPGGPTSTPTTNPSSPTSTSTTDTGGPTPTSTTNPGGPTPTPTTNPGGPTPTSTTNPGGPTPTSTTNPSGPTPTPNNPYTTIDTPGSVGIGETILVTVYLNNVPPSGYTSVEYTCTYPPDLVAISNILVTDLFGTDPAVAIFGPQGGSFIVAIAGSNGQKATTSGAVFSFNVTGLQAGQASIACVARASTGDGLLTVIDSVAVDITVGSVPTPTPTIDPGTISPVLAGQVLATKSVTVNLYDAGNFLIASTAANMDGTFSLTAPPGNYTVVAAAAGFLNAQGPAILTAGITTTKATISLLAGDIDGNNVIDQYDAMTIGMNYNMATPDAADLNADGTINVLDLEDLADNYRASGALNWQ
jgi:murein DD-endopeptidase MepM/ murein hydrolase activator NlpD